MSTITVYGTMQKGGRGVVSSAWQMMFNREAGKPESGGVPISINRLAPAMRHLRNRQRR